MKPMATSVCDPNIDGSAYDETDKGIVGEMRNAAEGQDDGYDQEMANSQNGM